MAELPVREMTLYKHGVGFFVREGAVNAEAIALTFHQDEINDVLKSLAVFDRSGGQVLGIHYQTPMDKAARLANSSIRLSDQTSLRDLLRDLRGRNVTVSVETTPGTLETITARVIGIDIPPMISTKFGQEGDSVGGLMLTLLGDDNAVRVYRLDALRAIQIHDTQSEHDLSYFLDTSMSEDTRRSVTIRLSEGEHDLVVYYVAPSPTWRVSYRIVAESEKIENQNSTTGKALLQGWGLFDNRLEEDLENVRVTLVAGQPISFIYELYASRIPKRPTVQDESRVAPGPIEFQGAADPLAEMEPLQWLESAGLMQGGNPPAPRVAKAMAAAPAAAPAPQMTRSGMAQSTAPAAQTKESGEFFQYAVTTPVSVKRGDSALVPIIGSDVSYDRELLYNGAKLPDHPVAALRFANMTGLTLERGPVTVVEDGDYKGEAVVPFTKDGNEVYLPYAVELGVKITERPYHETQTTGLNIEKAYLVYQNYEVYITTYVIENTTAKALTVTIEAPITINNVLFETRDPDVETATDRRWRVKIPARSRTEFIRKERQRTTRFEELRRLDYQNLSRFMENQWLDRATFDKLSGMIERFAVIQRSRSEQDMLKNQRAEFYQKQEQLRANLGTLNPTGTEAGLRNRMLGQLESAQDRLEEIDRRFEFLTTQIATAEAEINQIIAELG